MKDEFYRIKRLPPYVFAEVNALKARARAAGRDVIDRGIVMTGGGSLLRQIDRLLTKETGVPCYVADNPIACVALGAGKALENYDVIKRSLPAY